MPPLAPEDDDRPPNGHSSPTPPSPSPVRTTSVKVCIIGDSGVGKSSLRTRYLTKRFSPSYKATIGCDFVTHGIPMSEDETVSLAIWDTAGQERFASLSSAFFRGSDAAIFVYDRTKPDTLRSIRRWFGEFVDRCPVTDLEAKRRFCFVVVGNKADKVGVQEEEEVVSEEEVRALMDELVPPRPTPPPPPPPPPLETKPLPGSTSFSSSLASATSRLRTLSTSTKPAQQQRSSSPASSSRSTITVHHNQPQSIEIDPSTATSSQLSISNRKDSPPGGTTFTPTLYHTPSSSFYDTYGTHLDDRDPPPPRPPSSQRERGGSPQRPGTMGAASSMYSFNTARSNFTAGSGGTAVPFPSSSSTGETPPPTSAGAAAVYKRNNRSISANRSLSSTSSTATYRPASRAGSGLPPPPPSPSPSPQSQPSPSHPTPPAQPDSVDPTPPPQPQLVLPSEPAPPEEQPKIFLSVSAKSGQGVDEIFEYVARRVWERWAWEESGAGLGGEFEMEGGVDLNGGKGKGKKMGKKCGC